MVPCVALIFLAAPLALAIDADYQPYGDFYYAWYSGPKNFTDAENYCHGWSGTLTSVHSDGENAYVASRAEGNQLFWVGAEHPVGGDWSWTDGSAFDYNEFQGTVNSNVCVSVGLT
ncbi:hypothetical protein L596_023329 [Steinernema carpocapsae]|uniref:C-type lectin domain-containing protein n=1 Tax=Steinernema carpocapsae TaxID=34508 RepID=A0A4U5MDC3_STECR|nr:hypothetical protein L596_023329 [Steinernema carpocapsae]